MRRKVQINSKPKLRRVRKQNTGKYRDLDYDSLEELYFFHWCYDLLDRGYIKSIVRAEPYRLSDAITNNYIKRLKTKSKPMTQKVLDGHIYTPEVKIVWTERSLPILWVYGTPVKKDKEHLFVAHKEGNEIFSIVEIKPMHDFKNMERLVRLNIKWVLQVHNQWVNLIKNEILFPLTFTPLIYLKTPTGKKRKINFKIRTIESFLKQLDDTKLH